MARKFSMNKALGITKAKRSIARATGVPITKSGRKRKVKREVEKSSGCGCLILIIIAVAILAALQST